jgi:hypothetical protein
MNLKRCFVLLGSHNSLNIVTLGVYLWRIPTFEHLFFKNKLFKKCLMLNATWGSARCVERRAIHREALSRLWLGKVEDEEHLLLVCPNTQKVGPYPSPTLALLLDSCRLRTRSPWPSLWHAASTKIQFVLHDLPFV